MLSLKVMSPTPRGLYLWMSGNDELEYLVCIHIILCSKSSSISILLNRSIGCGSYPSLCLLNTCCDQNITKYYVNNTVVGVVSKLIRAGEEVSDNYYPTAFYMTRDERREWLGDHFMFQCQCVACEADLPLVADMPDQPSRYLPIEHN